MKYMPPLPRVFSLLLSIALTVPAAFDLSVFARTRGHSPANVKQSQDAEKVDANLVNVDFVVYQKKDGQVITGLKQNNVAVFLDGIQKEITSFSTPDRPVSAALLIEYSKAGSVLGDNRSLDLGTVAAGVAKSAGDAFAQLINRPNDRVSVVAFDMRPTALTDFTNDPKRVNEALSLLWRPGNSPAFTDSALFDALNFVLIGGRGDTAVLDKAAARLSDHIGLASVHGQRKAIILIASGLDTFSKINLKQFRKTMQNAAVPIFVIGTGAMFKVRAGKQLESNQKDQLKVAERQLKTIAIETGGAFFPYEVESDGPAIFEKIKSRLSGQYNLTFKSDEIHDGKAHQIVGKVDIDGDGIYDEQTLVVQARQVYDAPKN